MFRLSICCIAVIAATATAVGSLQAAEQIDTGAAAATQPVLPELVPLGMVMTVDADKKQHEEILDGIEQGSPLSLDGPGISQEKTAVGTYSNALQPTAAIAEDRISYVWSSAARRQPERRYVLFERPAVGGLLRYEYNQDVRVASGIKTADRSQSFVERLDLASKGFVYHPALLQFKLSFSPEFRQTMQTASELTGNTAMDGASFSPNFQANAVVLGRKPYTLSLFAQHLETQSWSTYTGILETRNDMYGADLSLKYQLLPTTIGFSTSRSEQDGYWTSSNRWREAHLLSRHRGKTGDSSLMAHYSINDQVTNDQSHDITTLNATFNNQYSITGDKRVSLASTMQYLQQDGDSLQNSSLLLNEQLAWQHLKHLQSRYTLNYRRFETGTTRNRMSSLDARLTHKLYENLTTTVGATGSLNSYTGGQEKAVTGLLDVDYQRRLSTWGSLNLHAGITNLYTSRTGEGGLLPVSNETVMLLTSTETFLVHAGVVLGSVVVTNGTGTIVYTRDIDYQLDLIGSSVRISRLPLGAISDGQAVLVSYSYTRDAGYDDAFLTQSYSAMLELKQTLFLSYRYLRARQTLLAGPLPGRLSNAMIHLATVRYDAGWSETGAVYEDNTSSSDISFRRWELNQALKLRYGSWLQFLLRGYWGETDYRSRTDSRKHSGLTTIFNWIPKTWLKVEMEGYLENISGDLEKTTNSGAKVGVTSSYRLWTARLSLKCAEQYNKLSDYKRTNTQVQVELLRAIW
jgi:hypothetical protein